jgi:hypothetical protein
MEKTMLSVLLYTKDDCGLCDEVKHELALLQADYPHQLTEIDITQDTAVFDRYKYIIPVVDIEGTQLQAPISRHDLELALKAVNQATSD